MIGMMRSVRWTAVVGGTLGFVASAQAQTAGPMRPTILSVTCERVKPGMVMAHDQHEEAWARASEAVPGFATSFALQSMTGPQETCWMTRVASFAQLGKNTDRFNTDRRYSAAVPGLLLEEAKYVSDVRGYVAALRIDLSEGVIPILADRRYANWGEWRIKPGNAPLFESAVKAYVAASKRAGVVPSFRVYQLLHGAPGDTYWIFTVQPNMAAFDTVMINDPKVMAAFTAEDRALFDELFAKAVVSRTTNLWAYNPAQSSVTADERATDPYWTRKPKAGVKQP